MWGNEYNSFKGTVMESTNYRIVTHGFENYSVVNLATARTVLDGIVFVETVISLRIISCDY